MTCVKKGVDRKCPTGKMSCNYNTSLTIFKEMCENQNPNLMVLWKFAVPSAPTCYILAAYICEFLFLGLCCLWFSDFRKLILLL